MIKQTIALAAGIVFSLNASAGYVQYNLDSNSSFIVENTADKSIAFYSINIGGKRFMFSGIYDYLYGQSSNFWGEIGPTNFSVYDRASEVYDSTATFNFAKSSTDGVYNFSGHFSQTIDPGYPREFAYALNPRSFSFSGTAALGPVNPQVAGDIVDYGAYYGSGMAHEVPVQNVPEPGSLALIAVGVLGAFGVARRRKV